MSSTFLAIFGIHDGYKIHVPVVVSRLVVLSPSQTKEALETGGFSAIQVLRSVKLCVADFTPANVLVAGGRIIIHVV